MRAHLIAATAIMLAGSASAADGIMPVRQNGRVIFVNAEGPAASSGTASGADSDCASTSPRSYVYWSGTQKRWKRVPAPSAAAVREACSAVKEVAATMASSSAPVTANVAPELAKRESAWNPTAVDGLVEEVAKRHNVDPNLVRAMIKVESNFNPRARSRKGAIGLMQLMPATARELKVANPYDPAQNLDGGVRRIKTLLENYNGDVALSLAAYNAGQGAVERHGGVPNYKETKAYVQRITNLYGSNTAVSNGRTSIKVTVDSDGHKLYTND
jgi:soluble lytic murein transglycosylase-like protein